MTLATFGIVALYSLLLLVVCTILVALYKAAKS